MSREFAIRLAEAGDVPRLLALQEAIAEAPHWSEAVYKGYVDQPSDALQWKALLVATHDNERIGFAAITALQNEAELESIAVSEVQRRHGLGSQLLDTAMTLAAAYGAVTVRLEVRAGNARAQAFYTSRGFAQVGVRRGYYRDPVDDAVLMQRNV